MGRQGSPEHPRVRHRRWFDAWRPPKENQLEAMPRHAQQMGQWYRDAIRECWAWACLYGEEWYPEQAKAALTLMELHEKHKHDEGEEYHNEATYTEENTHSTHTHTRNNNNTHTHNRTRTRQRIRMLTGWRRTQQRRRTSIIMYRRHARRRHMDRTPKRRKQQQTQHVLQK